MPGGKVGVLIPAFSASCFCRLDRVLCASVRSNGVINPRNSPVEGTASASSGVTPAHQQGEELATCSCCGAGWAQLTCGLVGAVHLCWALCWAQWLASPVLHFLPSLVHIRVLTWWLCSFWGAFLCLYPHRYVIKDSAQPASFGYCCVLLSGQAPIPSTMCPLCDPFCQLFCCILPP